LRCGATRLLQRVTTRTLDRMGQARAALMLLAALVACGNESFTDVEAVRAPLIAGLPSYAAPNEVLPKLASFPMPVVVEQSALPPNDGRPPFSIYSVSVREYRHLEHSGELRLLFFNDRLQETVFYPQDPAAYMAALKAAGVVVTQGQEWKTENTVVWTAVDYRGQRYVGWADQRLREQSKRWISRYS
jgi:hypothetical protein